VRDNESTNTGQIKDGFIKPAILKISTSPMEILAGISIRTNMMIFRAHLRTHDKISINNWIN
jgi:hypothetical protein